jgi:hypothetical protein
MDTEKWKAQIDRITTEFTNSFGSLSEAQLNWTPAPTTWSIAQNIDHLIIINKSYYPVIDSVRRGKYKVPIPGRFAFMVNFMGNMILNGVQPNRKRKIRTFRIWQPSESNIPADIIDRFCSHQEELKSLIAGSIDLLDKNIIISSPANRNIVYKLDTAFDIIVTHEQRHFEQSREMLKLMKEQKVY